ncbi:thiamine ABC transporter ATP-binding protein [Actinobacillus delphinicola]|uniref:thiamine ABC transporter ATP-binding protein n=1 Tax=Actinobacillus delphinicola TaxID=51161 RepID=UPI0024417696|nr:thiamine ABC transporter ATP-binding protein [Actinobacillus delphinicola]MDG6896913.1 thiamine ABC transporter ATP-binding protein [Actinobacillus delphinicola]
MIQLQIDFDYPDMPMHFSLSAKKGEKIALIGESGAGKSTLLNLIAGFEWVSRGKIWLNGKNCTLLQPAERPVAMLFQDNNLFTHLTVEQNLALGIKPSLKINASERDAICQAAKAVGLDQHLSRLPEQLSGGQRQRVAIARCLLQHKPILLLDEPFSALDPVLRQEMLDLILDLCQKQNTTLLMVTHQVDEIQGKFDRILEVKQGHFVK